MVILLIHDLQLAPTLPVILHVDNKLACLIAKNPYYHSKTKHIEIDVYVTCHHETSGFLKLSHVPSTNRLVDLMTKALFKPQLHLVRSKLGLLESPTWGRGVVKL